MTTTKRLVFFSMTLLCAGWGLACGSGGLHSSGGKTCTQNGQTYKAGETFKWDCNTCTCMADGTAECTLVACLGTGGFAPPGGSAAGGSIATGGFAAGGAGGAGGMAGQTTSPDAGSPLPCTVNGHTYQVGETFEWDCNTCTCTATGASCTLMLCPPGPDGGADASFVEVGPAVDAGVVCSYGGTTLLPGQSVSDGCNICACSTSGALMCTERACPLPDAAQVMDVGAGTCPLSSNLTFGYDGGMVTYQDSNKLTANTFTVTRTFLRGANPDGATSASCSPKLPACGAAAVVSVATIDADLANADVQMAFATAETSGTLYGVDQRPVDGSVYSIALDDGRKVLVGPQCGSPVMNSCRTVPPGLVQLTSDLLSLASAMLADPICKGL